MSIVLRKLYPLAGGYGLRPSQVHFMRRQGSGEGCLLFADFCRARYISNNLTSFWFGI
jgi:hypothetical protein